MGLQLPTVASRRSKPNTPLLSEQSLSNSPLHYPTVGMTHRRVATTVYLKPVYNSQGLASGHFLPLTCITPPLTYLSPAPPTSQSNGISASGCLISPNKGTRKKKKKKTTPLQGRLEQWALYIPFYPFGLFPELKWFMFFFIILILKHHKNRGEKKKRKMEEGRWPREKAWNR